MNLDNLGGRKFILAVFVIIILTVVAVIKPEALNAEFVSGLIGIVASFSIANTMTTVKAMGQRQPDEFQSESPEVTVPESNDELKTEIMYLENKLQPQIDELKVSLETQAKVLMSIGQRLTK